MSRNAFAQCEREYNEREEAREMARAEREQVRPDAQHVLDAVRAEKVLMARERHGKPFAYETGSAWKPRSVPLLTEWMQSRNKEVK